MTNTIFLLLSLLFSGTSANLEYKTAPSHDLSSPDLWEKISETTWKYDGGFSKESYAFFTDNQGNRKCIHQVFGSGFLVLEREYVAVEFLPNNLVRIDGIVFKFMKYDLMVSISSNLILESRSPQVGWQLGWVDMEKVRSEEFDVADVSQP